MPADRIKRYKSYIELGRFFLLFFSPPLRIILSLYFLSCTKLDFTSSLLILVNSIYLPNYLHLPTYLPTLGIYLLYLPISLTLTGHVAFWSLIDSSYSSSSPLHSLSQCFPTSTTSLKIVKLISLLSHLSRDPTLMTSPNPNPSPSLTVTRTTKIIIILVTDTAIRHP